MKQIVVESTESIDAEVASSIECYEKHNQFSSDELKHHTSKKRKKDLCQYFTPNKVSKFMANLFSPTSDPAILLEPSAGKGSLLTAAIETLEHVQMAEAWEIDRNLCGELHETLSKLNAPFRLHSEDFIYSGLAHCNRLESAKYTHVILNPPYKKMSPKSLQGSEMKKFGLEVTNLYAAFLSLAIKMSKNEAQIIAIIPRSFCNGAYFKKFRKYVLSTCAIVRIHQFTKRKGVFDDKNVLQETIVVKLVKGGAQGHVDFSESADCDLANLHVKSVKFEDVLEPDDPECFIRFPIANSVAYGSFLSNIGTYKTEIQVSTGPFIHHKHKALLNFKHATTSAPLIDRDSFKGVFNHEGVIANYVEVNETSKSVLLKNEGYYVIVMRISSIEERRRLVAVVLQCNEEKYACISFDNHLNVIHSGKGGFDQLLANGLACYLNSTIADEMLRTYAGSTQVNATDIRQLKILPPRILRKIGAQYCANMGNPPNFH